MKRAAFILATAALAGAGGCARQESKPAPKAEAAATDARQAEREAHFGAEALAPDVTWRESGLGYRIVVEGAGPRPGIGATVRFNYVGRLKDGTVFDRSTQPAEMQLGRMVAGLSTGLQLLNTGGRAVIFVPPQLGYGSARVMGIPANSGLIFEVELLAVNP